MRIATLGRRVLPAAPSFQPAHFSVAFLASAIVIFLLAAPNAHAMGQPAGYFSGIGTGTKNDPYEYYVPRPAYSAFDSVCGVSHGIAFHEVLGLPAIYHAAHDSSASCSPVFSLDPGTSVPTIGPAQDDLYHTAAPTADDLAGCDQGAGPVTRCTFTTTDTTHDVLPNAAMSTHLTLTFNMVLGAFEGGTGVFYKFRWGPATPFCQNPATAGYLVMSCTDTREWTAPNDGTVYTFH